MLVAVSAPGAGGKEVALPASGAACSIPAIVFGDDFVGVCSWVMVQSIKTAKERAKARRRLRSKAAPHGTGS